MSKVITTAIGIVQGHQNELNEALSDPIFIHFRLELKTYYDKILMRLKGMQGTIEPDMAEKVDDQFPPITEFMGEKILVNRKAEVVKAEASEDEKAIFNNKVIEFLKRIETIKTDDIVRDFTSNEDVLILRAAAKKASIDDYEDAAITVPFVDDIKAGIAKLRADKKDKAKRDKNATSGASALKFPYTVKDEDLENPIVKEAGAKSGDVLIVDKDGVISIQPAF